MNSQWQEILIAYNWKHEKNVYKVSLLVNRTKWNSKPHQNISNMFGVSHVVIAIQC